MTSNINIIELNPNELTPSIFNNITDGVEDIKINYDYQKDFIEFYIFNPNNIIIYPFDGVFQPKVKIVNNYLQINPQQNLEDLGYNLGKYKVLYNFYRNYSNITSPLIFNDISESRTEVSLNMSQLKFPFDNIDPEIYELYLNFGENTTIEIINFKIENNLLYLKLQEPLLEDFINVWISQKISNSKSYEIEFIQDLKNINNNIKLNFPDFSLYENPNNEQSKPLNLNNLTQNNSQGIIESLLKNKGITLNIDYSNFKEFVHFSSAYNRILVFFNKIKEIQDLQQNEGVLNEIIIKEKVDKIFKSFDKYEFYLYNKEYPKDSNNELLLYDSIEVLEWLGSIDNNSSYFGGLLLNASNYDIENPNLLSNLIPQYIRENNENELYALYLNLIGHHYDKIWVYIKNITNKFDNDNRLNIGISQDLITEVLRDFGVNLYNNSYSNTDLENLFFGQNLNNLLTQANPAEFGKKYVDNIIENKNNKYSLDEISKLVHKRIYNNLIYLLKSKGSKENFQSLISIYGISNNILDVNSFGDNYKTNKKNIYNYSTISDGESNAVNTSITNYNISDLNITFRYKPISDLNNIVSICNIIYNDNILPQNIYLKMRKEIINELYNGFPYKNKYFLYIEDENNNILNEIEIPFNKNWNLCYIFSENGVLKIKNIIENNIYELNTNIDSSYTLKFLNLQGVSPLITFQEIKIYNELLDNDILFKLLSNPYLNNIESLIYRLSLGSFLPKFVEDSFKIENDNISSIIDGVLISNNEIIDQPSLNIGISNIQNDNINILENDLIDQNILSQYNDLEKNIENKNTINKNLDVSFSPQKQIDFDIQNNLNFNIDDYIGELSDINSTSNHYELLTKLRNDYFAKYNTYNIKDFFSIIKYFDNSLFKLIQDFTPIKNRTTSGVLVKQHSLERTKHRPPQLSYKNNTYKGQIKPQIKDYKLTPNPVSPYNTKENNNIYIFDGGTGGKFEKFNISNFPQEKNENIKTQFGPITLNKKDQEEFYTGEFNKVDIIITNGDLNDNPYLNIPNYILSFKCLFFIKDLTVPLNDWKSSLNSPNPGHIWVMLDQISSQEFNIINIKVSNEDLNGDNISLNLLSSNLNFLLIFNISNPINNEFTIDINTNSYQNNGNHILFITEPQNITSGEINSFIERGSMEWALNASYTTQNNELSTIGSVETSDKILNLWDDPIIDPFNINEGGEILLPQTPNVPLSIRGILKYNLTDNGETQIVYEGIYTGGITPYPNSEGLHVFTSPFSSYTLNMFPIEPTINLPSGFNTNIENFNSVNSFINPILRYSPPNDPTIFSYPLLGINGVTEITLDFNEIPYNGFTNLKRSKWVPFDYNNNDIPINVIYENNSFGPFSPFNFNPTTGWFELYSQGDFIFGDYDKLSVITGFNIINNENSISIRLVVKDSINDSDIYLYQDSITISTTGNQQFITTNFEVPFNILPSSTVYMRLEVFINESSSFSYNINNSLWKFPEINILFEPTSPDLNLLQFDQNNSTNFIPITLPTLPPTNYIQGDFYINLLYFTPDGNITILESSTIASNFIFDGSPLNVSFNNPIIHDPVIEKGMYGLQYVVDNILFTSMIASVEFLENLNMNFSIKLSDINPSVPLNFFVNGELALSQSEKLFDGSYSNYEIVDTQPFSTVISTPNINDPLEVVELNVNTPSFNNNLKQYNKYKLHYIIEKGFNTNFNVKETGLKLTVKNSLLSQALTNYTTGDIFWDFYPNLPEPMGFIIEDYYGPNTIPFENNLDFHPLLNNYISSRLNSRLMDVNYNQNNRNNANLNIPNNLELILNNEAKKSEIPDSNYTSYKSIALKYLGSKTSSLFLNKWSYNDTNTFGKNPVIELKNAFFGYFDKIINPYPNLNNSIILNINYLIDESSNIIPPSIEKGGRDILLKTFKKNTLCDISSNEGDKELKNLTKQIPIIDIGYEISPIFYTQISDSEFSDSIEFTNKNNINIPPIIEGESFSDLTFSVIGEADNIILPTNGIINNSSEFEVILNPQQLLVNNFTESIPSPVPYIENDGILKFNDELFAIDNKTSQSYEIQMETSFSTTFLYESGNIELKSKLKLENINTNKNEHFIINDIELFVSKAGIEEPINLGSIISEGNNLIRFATNKINQEPNLNNNNELEMLIENYALNNFLTNKNLYKKGTGGVGHKGDITLITFKITAYTEPKPYNINDQLRWVLSGNVRGKEHSQTNVFYPTLYTNKIFPTTIKTIGNKNHNIDNSDIINIDNGSFIIEGNKFIIQNPKLIFIYGKGFIQKDLPFTPNLEMDVDSKFNKVVNSFEFKIGDQIRFSNNENYVYNIIKIIPPQETINNDKIILICDKEINTNINKLFFLIRRLESNPNNIILGRNINIPEYTNKGIIYPEYPTEGVKNNASQILQDLIGKGVIK